MAAVVWQQRQTAAAGQSRPGVVNQRVARVFVRVRRSGVLTFAAISGVGVLGSEWAGGRVESGHGFFREPPCDKWYLPAFSDPQYMYIQTTTPRTSMSHPTHNLKSSWRYRTVNIMFTSHREDVFSDEFTSIRVALQH